MVVERWEEDDCRLSDFVVLFECFAVFFEVLIERGAFLSPVLVSLFRGVLAVSLALLVEEDAFSLGATVPMVGLVVEDMVVALVEEVGIGVSWLESCWHLYY